MEKKINISDFVKSISKSVFIKKNIFFPLCKKVSQNLSDKKAKILWNLSFKLWQSIIIEKYKTTPL